MPIHSLTDARPYEVVVYGASVAGVLLALRHAAAGRSVLLLNTYGFAGGAVTESLNCLQAPPRATAAQGQALFAALAADPHYAFGETPAGQILNPEVLKFGLQHALEQSAVTLLYHVKARALEAAGPDGLLTLHLIGKEGEFVVRGQQVLDASDTEYLARLVQGGRPLQAACLRAFTSALPPVADAAVRQLPHLARAERLPDGRYWLSFDLPTGIDPLFIEGAANDQLDALTAALAPLGGRLQLVPAETQLVYAPATPTQPNFSTVAGLLPGRSYLSEHWLQRAVDAEAASA